LALGATVSTEQTEVRNAGLLRVMSVLSTVPEGQQGLNKCTVTPAPHLGTDEENSRYSPCSKIRHLSTFSIKKLIPHPN
jgi:hypothetical protein